ncbi:MAG TPA: O-antigen ligase family protein [Verrucomicrobiae bacterium]|nr:O-antigen ligase family protein [Verrucomicrobiae bacterium]
MKQVSVSANNFTDYLVAFVLTGVPFYAFLTVWGSTIVGHYTALRLWDDVLLLIVFVLACWWLAHDRELWKWFTHSLLVRLIAAYTVLTFSLGVVALVKGEVTGEALAYGLLINLRFLVWFLAVFLAGQRSPWLRRTWPRLLLLPAAVVVIFAVLQYTLLPHDFLSHFGYNTATTIEPIETINHNSDYIRVQSTLRGANPLGAYLIIVLSAISVLYIRGRRKLLCVVLGITTLIALYASGSRSAWIGAALSIVFIAWSQLEGRRRRLIFGSIGLAVVVCTVLGYILFKNNARLQNEVLHTQTNTSVKATSNGAHVSALVTGVRDVVQQPFGDGPGTAGPASVYNGTHPARIAEDYYVQVAQETGWLGLILFLSILTLTALELYDQTKVSRLSLITFASLIGIAFVNLLSHAWADDTLAYLWWGLAGIALARPPRKDKDHV